MPEVEANGVRLHYDEWGEGSAILCIHGVGSSGLAWEAAAAKLAGLGRVIAYDRRGHTRSERPQPYEVAAVSDHAADAAALLDALDASPAVFIGRSYGGGVAIELAVREPSRVRALVLLDGDAPPELAPSYGNWLDRLRRRIDEVAETDGVDADGQALTTEAIGPGAWEQFPEPMRRMFTENGPAILADLRGEWLRVMPSELAAIAVPALVVTASDSPVEFRELAASTAQALPDARLVEVPGGHMIDPAGPDVLAFVDEALAGR